MPRTELSQSQIARFLKGVRAAGVEVDHIEFVDGRLVVFGAQSARDRPRTALQQWILENGQG